MKKCMMIISAALLLGAAGVQAGNNVYTGNAGDNDFNNDANWWNSLDPTDSTFFRGDNLVANPTWAFPNLSATATVSRLVFQGTNPGSYTFSGEKLTIDGNGDTQTLLIESQAANTNDQTFANSVELVSINNANNRHIKTTGTGTLIFSGILSQGSASSGLGIGLGYGDIEISGSVDGASKLWKLHNDAGDGILRFTDTGTWNGAGTVQIAAGADVLLARDTTDSTGFAPGVLQIQGGTLTLGNDEQILNGLEVNFFATSGWFNLDGNTETILGLKFGNASYAGVIDMGDGGVLHLSNQNSANIWGSLIVTNWNEGSDHIYVDGGSFGVAQLAAITFDGQSAGAQVVSGELYPASLVVVENNIYNGLAGDSDLNNDANWSNSLGDNDVLFFRGDNIASNPAWASPSLSVTTTVSAVKFQDSPGAAYILSGAELTVNGATYGETILMDTVTSSYTQTFSNDVVLVSANNANNRHIKTTGSGTLLFAGTLSQDSASAGLGIGLNNGDIEVSGDINGASKLWKLHNDGGAGIMKLTGSGTWSGAGTMQVANGSELLLNRSVSNGFAPGVLQVLNGTLTLGADEQILDGLEVSFSASDGIFNLAGNEETITGLRFTGAYSDTIAMGDGGVLRFDAQSSTATWGTLTVTEWESGVDHLYVDGGSFGVSQLAAITFDGYEAGAKVEGGELLPDGAPLGFSGWIDNYGLTGSPDADADYDYDGDGVANLSEYGFGGDPTNATVTGTLPIFEISGDAVTIIHVELTSAISGISYAPQQTPELVSPSWTTDGISFVGESADVDGFKTVTNQVSSDAAEKFLKVFVEQD